MILGRNAGMWLGVVAALLNVAVLVFGVPLTVEQLASLNAAAAAVIGLVANEADPTTVGTFARTVTAPSPMAVTSSGVTASPPGTPATPTGGGDPLAGGGPSGGGA